MGIWDSFYEKAKSFFTRVDNEEGSSNTEKPIKKRCYYDLLEVDRDAAEDDIKKAFKRLALRWHPDKNPGKEDECSAYFVLIQQAYEVLSDPQERAFYDKHRENILYANSNEDEGPDECKDTGIVLNSYMSTSCWRGIFASEEERLEKFYSVYRDLFHQLAAEEYAYIEDPDDRNYPVFGTYTSKYETVVAPFYAFWLNFSTCQSFAWLDKWDLRDAPDRQSTRIMERENRKLREQGRKQRSDEVRKLVEFIRKHDKRVELARQRQKERNAEIQKRVEEQRREVIRRNLEKTEAFEVDEEAHREHLMDLEQIEQELDAAFGTISTSRDLESGSDTGSGENDDEKELSCIICEKSFKSRNGLESHQRSKRHRQMVEMVRTHMREEDQQLFEEEGVNENEEQLDEEKQQDMGTSAVKRKKRKPGKATKNTAVLEEEKHPNSTVESNGLNANKEADEEQQREEQKQQENVEATDNKTTATKKTKRKGQNAANRKNDQQKQQREPAGPVSCQCMNCGAEFESKSKLHAHLKETGHAMVKTVPPTMGSGSRKKGGKSGGVKGTAQNNE